MESDLDGENEDDDHPDFTGLDGSQCLTDPNLLASSGVQSVYQALDCPEPSQKDSVLLTDPDLMSSGTFCVQ